MEGRRRVDQLKMLAAIREILHNDESCVPFFEPFSIQFEKILHSVALRTSLYNVDSCIVLCDLAEEFLASLVLTDSHTKHRVLIEKGDFIDWNFWILVIQRMLAGQNINTILRALAFLFNVWDSIPISPSNTATRNSSETPRITSNTGKVFDLFDEQEGLRWNCALWLLSSGIWKVYFCHWNPMVRAYYLRLICWRVASVGSESGLLSSVLFSNYNDDARQLLEKRLKYTFYRFRHLNRKAKTEGRAVTSAVACQPATNRKFVIAFNPASSQSKPSMSFSTEGFLSPLEQHGPPIRPSSPTSTRRIDPYEVFDDVAYSFPTVTPPSDQQLIPPSAPEIPSLSDSTFSRGSKSSSAMESFGNIIRKKWSSFRRTSTGNLRKRLSHSTLRSEITPTPSNLYSVSEYAPSLTSSTTVSSSIIRTPASGSSMSDVRSSRSLMSMSSTVRSIEVSSRNYIKRPGSPSSLTMSLIPPPPQLLRKRPEILRPLYRFNLDYTEPLTHQEIIRQAKEKVSAMPSDFTLMPRLPFDSEQVLDNVESNGNSRTVKGPENRSTERLEYFASDLVSSEEDSEDEDRYNQESAKTEFEHMHLSSAERNWHKDMDDTKYWKYGGRSINEWNAIVKEFEDFVIKQRRELGLVRLEDLPFPFVIAEITYKTQIG